MPTPTMVAARRADRLHREAIAPRMAYSTRTGDAPRPLGQNRATWDCPGCTGEASKSIGARLGCTVCPL